jgi:3-phosphoshikimate 1-carboxyvinyltransferase
MKQRVAPAKSLRGEVTLPGDKSISHRATLIGSISKGISEIENYCPGEDCNRTIEAMRQLGVEIVLRGGKLRIDGRGLHGLSKAPAELYAGNSGTLMRLLAGILSGQPFESVLAGDRYLNRRPMKRIIEPLSLMGAEISGDSDQYPPLKIKGRQLSPICYRTPIPSAQVKSAILLAGLYADGETTVVETSQSRDHSERMLEAGGAEIERQSTKQGFQISVKGNPKLLGQNLSIPGDASSAAFFVVAATIMPGSQVVMKDVGLNSTRCGLLEVLTQMGADIRVENQREQGGEPVGDLEVNFSPLEAVKVEGKMIPALIDEIPVLAAAATQARGESVIRDAGDLRKKETDRISALVTNLRKMGAVIEELPDGMVIEGEHRLTGASVESFGDHRIAMALAVAALVAQGETTLDGWEWTLTSFPGFMEKLYSLRKG